MHCALHGSSMFMIFETFLQNSCTFLKLLSVSKDTRIPQEIFGRETVLAFLPFLESDGKSFKRIIFNEERSLRVGTASHGGQKNLVRKKKIKNRKIIQ